MGCGPGACCQFNVGAVTVEAFDKPQGTSINSPDCNNACLGHPAFGIYVQASPAPATVKCFCVDQSGIDAGYNPVNGDGGCNRCPTFSANWCGFQYNNNDGVNDKMPLILQVSAVIAPTPTPTPTPTPAPTPTPNPQPSGSPSPSIPPVSPTGDGGASSNLPAGGGSGAGGSGSTQPQPSISDVITTGSDGIATTKVVTKVSSTGFGVSL
ncbi:hypothetical protein HK101_009543 [Irineochytrium annulatum]|nr:hypothetical protein HK101_009543 [Irineochytrium annulatum]